MDKGERRVVAVAAIARPCAGCGDSETEQFALIFGSRTTYMCWDCCHEIAATLMAASTEPLKAMDETATVVVSFLKKEEEWTALVSSEAGSSRHTADNPGLAVLYALHALVGNDLN